jgi:hypothetical protein
MACLANPGPDTDSEHIIAISHWESFLSQASRSSTYIKLLSTFVTHMD